jgi:hypothetical protein
MEKKFKNQLGIKGSFSLLKAFSEELENIGYKAHSKSNIDTARRYGIMQINQYGGNGIYGYWSNLDHMDCNPTILFLPQDWNKALQLASETEEIIPEYVECIVDSAKNDCGTSNIEKGRIVKVSKEYAPSSKDRFYTVSPGDLKIIAKNYPWKDDNSLAGTGYYYFKDFKPSTREAYEAQLNAPKYKVGDFAIANDKSELWYVTAIENKDYKLWVERDNKYVYYSISVLDEANYISKATDEQTLNFLKEHYAKQGIVEGARVTWGNQVSIHSITRFSLVKKEILQGIWDNGNSQLCIITDYDCKITPTTDGFKVLPKEVKVAGYEVEKLSNTIDRVPLIIKIGCQHYTKDSLITIRDIIQTELDHANENHIIVKEEQFWFNHSTQGKLYTSIKELNQAIALFDQQ